MSQQKSVLKTFAEMTYDEQVAWAAGHLIVAIGEGQFREAVAQVIAAVSQDAFERGKAQANPTAETKEGQ